jgi:hypothetical protein
LSSIRLIDCSYSSLCGGLALLLLAAPAFAARDKVFSCEDGNGHRVFQDVPCNVGLKPWERDLSDRTRWTRPIRTGDGCAVRSPSVALSWLRADQTILFDGGVSLVLLASESGVAATIVVEAAWPNGNNVNANRTLPVVNAEAPSNVAPDAIATDAATSNAMPSTTDIVAAPSLQTPAITQSAKRLELSGNIAGHAILPDEQEGFVVDSMEDPTRMRFGYRQTGNLLRALKKAAALKFRLTLRSPEVQVISDNLELNGLDKALAAVTRCAERAQR